MRSDVNEMSRRENFVRPDLVYTSSERYGFSSDFEALGTEQKRQKFGNFAVQMEQSHV